MELARVYTRGKVVPSKEFLKKNGLILTEEGKLIYEKGLNPPDPDLLVEGEICLLDDEGKSDGYYIPLEPEKFKKWFRFGDCSNKEACVVKISAKVAYSRNDCP